MIPENENGPEAFLASYRDRAHEEFTAPPPQLIVARAGRRARNRVVLAAAAAVVLVLGGLVVAIRPVARPGPDHPVNPPTFTTSAPGPAPAPSTPGTPTTPSTPSTPSPEASSRPAGTTTQPSTSRSSTAPPLDLREVGWNDFVVRLPSNRVDQDCPVGRTELTDGDWAESGDHGPGTIRGSYSGAPVYGDLDGDGRAEAVRYIACFAAGGDSGDSSGQLIVITARGSQRVGLGYAGPLAAVYDDVRVTGGKLVVTVTAKYSDEQQTRTYRWNGSAIVQIDGPTAWPPVK
jgi:hypothetical protein